MLVCLYAQSLVQALTDGFTGLQDQSDATIETLKAIEHPISKQAQILVEACSYAGTGNVLRVQAMVHHCVEHVEKDWEESKPKDENKDDNKDEKKEETPKPDDTFQAFAVLGVALIAMGEDIGAEMSIRQFNHLVSLSFPKCSCELMA